MGLMSRITGSVLWPAGFRERKGLRTEPVAGALNLNTEQSSFAIQIQDELALDRIVGRCHHLPNRFTSVDLIDNRDVGRIDLRVASHLHGPISRRARCA